jgi:hypothetical protein
VAAPDLGFHGLRTLVVIRWSDGHRAVDVSDDDAAELTQLTHLPVFM